MTDTHIRSVCLPLRWNCHGGWLLWWKKN